MFLRLRKYDDDDDDDDDNDDDDNNKKNAPINAANIVIYSLYSHNTQMCHATCEHQTEMFSVYHRVNVQANLQLFQLDAQLSQRDRTARCVIVFAKSRRLELADNILQTL